MFGLIPLETLPGWPEAPEPTLIEAFVLFLGIPGAITAVILLMIAGPSWIRRDRQNV